MRTYLRSPAEEKGSAFFIVTALVVVAVVLVGAFLKGSLGKAGHVNLQVAEGRAFNAAEAGLDALIADVFRFYSEAAPRTRVTDLDPLDGKFDPALRCEIRDRTLGSSTYSAWVRSVCVSGNRHADVEIVARGEDGGAVKVISAVVRYGHRPARVFDHAYFINRSGRLRGRGVRINGSVGSNGDFSVGGALVNGDIHAGENPELGAPGTIEGEFRNDSLSDYNAHQADRARPSNPTAPTEDANGNGALDPGEDRNGNGVLDTYDLQGGYAGTVERKEHQQKLSMPTIGDLGTGRDLATGKNGTISQGGVTIVDAVLGDQEGEDRDLVLAGTAENPIVISGPVVVENDVVLSGVITGQGTIYAGRNIHIRGDLTYADPPSWEKPVVDITALRAANRTKDLVGLAARGSVLIGNDTASGVRQVDAVIYTDHQLSGRVGTVEFNGALICGEDALIHTGNLTINYDVRVGHGRGDFIEIDLPREPDHRILFWREGVGAP